MTNTFNYISTKDLNTKLQTLLEQGHVDENFVEQVRDALLFKMSFAK